MPDSIPISRAVLAGLCGSLVGIGLARFGYTPLVTPIIDAGWFSVDAAFYLGAANLAGYLIGAIAAGYLARIYRPRHILRAMTVGATLSFLACAMPAPFAWFFIWRLVSGIAGGVLMALGAPVVLKVVPVHQNGKASGIIFMGVGIGAALAALVIPALIGVGLTVTWLGLGALSAALTLIAWSRWPDPEIARKRVPDGGRKASGTHRVLCLQYGLNAAALVPHMVFLVDFVSRQLGGGLALGAFAWTLFGLGAIAGPFLAGAAADRFGYDRSFRAILVLQVPVIAIVAISPTMPLVLMSGCAAGAATPGIVPLVLGLVRQSTPEIDERTRAWGQATAVFGLLQAVGAYGFTALLSAGGHYGLLFACAAGLVLFALGLDPLRRRLGGTGTGLAAGSR